MTMLGGRIALARFVTVVLPADEIVRDRLPLVCALTGSTATEWLRTRVVGRRTPLWLLFFGVVPYAVGRVLPGSNGTVHQIDLPVSTGVADRLALARTAQLLCGLVAITSVFAAAAAGSALLLLLDLPALAAFSAAGLIRSALSVRPRLRNGSVVLEVSEQLRDAIAASRQPV